MVSFFRDKIAVAKASEAESAFPVPTLTRANAADPRTFCRLADAVLDHALGIDGGKKKQKATAPLDTQRMIDVLERVCETLTRRKLAQANLIDADPVQALRDCMADSEADVKAVVASYAKVDEHWKTVEERFGDKAPTIPATANYIQPEEKASERLLQKAAGHMDRLLKLINDMLAGRITSIDAGRRLDLIEDACQRFTGQDLRDVADRWLSPLRRFQGPLQSPPAELVEVREAYHQSAEVTAEEKARWDGLIDTALILQHAARYDPAKYMVYVFRDADPSRAGQVMELEWFHVSWFGVWLDPIRPNSLIMAPPGHGKTFCLAAMDTWEMGYRPELRFLLLLDQSEKANKEVMRHKKVILSLLFRAVFPSIRVLGRMDNEREQQGCFTVARKNQAFSREATAEGHGIFGNFNGDGVDRIAGDDFSPPQCREEPNQRKRVCNKFTDVVEERRRDAEDSRIRIIHTPWHPQDAVGLIRQDAAAGRLPTWRVQIDPYAIRDDAQGRPIPLWPRKRNAEWLEERKWRMGQNYDCNYRLQAADVNRRALTRVGYYNATDRNATANDEALADGLYEGSRTLSIDPAGSDARTASDTGVIDGIITRNGWGFLTDVQFLHLAPTALLEWVVERVIKAWRDGHRYEYLMMEGQGGIKGMVSTWEDWIPKELLRLGMPEKDHPRILTPGTRQGAGQTGQNRGKLKRLREAAPYLERGSVRLAGQRVWNQPLKKYLCEAVRGSRVERLAGMMMEFDGTTPFDAGDAATQWILWNKDELQDPWAKPAAQTAAPPRPLDPMSAALAKSLADMRKPKEPSQPEDDAIAVQSKYLPGQGLALQGAAR